MKRFWAYLVSFLVVISACQNNDLHKRVFINYDKLPSIKCNLIKEISENDNFLPDKLGDLFLDSDGNMVVSDLGKTTIEQIDFAKGHLKTVAKRGKGPGEIATFYFSLTEGGKDTLLLQQSYGEIAFFARKKSNIYEYVKSIVPEIPMNRKVDLIGYSSRNEYYYARIEPAEVRLVRSDVSEYRKSPISLLNDSMQIVKDSLYLLKTPNYLFGSRGNFPNAITMNGLPFLGIPPYRYQDRFRLMEEGRYMIARPDSNALYIYTEDHKLDKRIYLNVKKRRIEESDLDYAFKHHRTAGRSVQIRRELEAHVDELKPPFLNIWVSGDRILLHTDNGKEGKELVVLTMQGEPLGKLYLSEFDEIQYFRDNRIYTLYKNPEKGHTVRIYQIFV